MARKKKQPEVVETPATLFGLTATTLDDIPEEDTKVKKPALFDFIGSINFKTGNILDSDRPLDNTFPSYIINTNYSFFPDTILISNELNCSYRLTPKQVYDCYYYGLSKKKRYSKWIKEEPKEEYIEYIKFFYKVSDRIAMEYMDVLSLEQCEELKRRFVEIELGKSPKRKTSRKRS